MSFKVGSFDNEDDITILVSEVQTLRLENDTLTKEKSQLSQQVLSAERTMLKLSQQVDKLQKEDEKMRAEVKKLSGKAPKGSTGGGTDAELVEKNRTLQGRLEASQADVLKARKELEAMRSGAGGNAGGSGTAPSGNVEVALKKLDKLEEDLAKLARLRAETDEFVKSGEMDAGKLAVLVSQLSAQTNILVQAQVTVASVRSALSGSPSQPVSALTLALKSSSREASPASGGGSGRGFKGPSPGRAGSGGRSARREDTPMPVSPLTGTENVNPIAAGNLGSLGKANGQNVRSGSKRSGGSAGRRSGSSGSGRGSSSRKELASVKEQLSNMEAVLEKERTDREAAEASRKRLAKQLRESEMKHKKEITSLRSEQMDLISAKSQADREKRELEQRYTKMLTSRIAPSGDGADDGSAEEISAMLQKQLNEKNALTSRNQELELTIQELRDTLQSHGIEVDEETALLAGGSGGKAGGAKKPETFAEFWKRTRKATDRMCGSCKVS